MCLIATVANRRSKGPLKLLLSHLSQYHLRDLRTQSSLSYFCFRLTQCHTEGGVMMREKSAVKSTPMRWAALPLILIDKDLDCAEIVLKRLGLDRVDSFEDTPMS
jgi:hypothetical protein